MSNVPEDLTFKHFQEGKVAAVILAGGQGTRLGSALPKGCYPISPIMKKSLFQLALEKTKAATSLYAKKLEIAFMTSPENETVTKTYIQEQHFFGLEPSQVHFFSQSTLPLTDENKVPLYTNDNTPLVAADGNGSFFFNLVKSPIFSSWKKKGVEYVTVTVIDNPLSDPFDFELVHRHLTEHNEVTLRVIERHDPHECVGAIIEDKQGIKVIEYSELSQEQKEQRDQSGMLLVRYANISYFCFSLTFIEKIGKMPINNFPLHVAKKRPQGISFPVLKSEYFIFDALPFSQKTGLLPSKRELFFAPVKNKEGTDSPATCQKALFLRDKEQYKKISGVPLKKEHPFELSMNFYYPTPQFLEKWKNVPLPELQYLE